MIDIKRKISYYCNSNWNHDMDIKVAIYEDNDAFRDTLSHLIKGSGLLTFIGSYPDCSNILENCELNTPDVILMDIDMPGISGIDAN